MNDINDFDGFDNGIGMPTEERWAYPTIGYNSRDGIFYVGDDQQKSIDGITLLAVRQCKEIVDASGVTHRYPLRTRKVDMAQGDFTSRLQIVCVVDGELYLFGARSWTARAAFMNPGGGPYSDANFARGIWHDLADHVKQIKAETGKNLPPFCWSFSLAVAPKAITVGTGKNTSKSYPFARASEFQFVGAEEAHRIAALYQDEAIAEWVEEWASRETIAAPIDLEPEPIPTLQMDDDIPF